MCLLDKEPMSPFFQTQPKALLASILACTVACRYLLYLYPPSQQLCYCGNTRCSDVEVHNVPARIREYALSGDELRATPIQLSFYGRIEKGPSERTGSLAQSWLDNVWFLPPSYLSLSFSQSLLLLPFPYLLSPIPAQVGSLFLNGSR